MAGDNITYRSSVLLVGFGRDGEVIEETDMSYEDYSEGSPPLIDEDEYREKGGIRRVTGKVYDSAGHLQQEFENHYDEGGRYVRSRVVHEDSDRGLNSAEVAGSGVKRMALDV